MSASKTELSPRGVGLLACFGFVLFCFYDKKITRLINVFSLWNEFLCKNFLNFIFLIYFFIDTVEYRSDQIRPV